MEVSVSKQENGIKVVFFCDSNNLEKAEAISYNTVYVPNQKRYTLEQDAANKSVFITMINEPKNLVFVTATFKDKKASFALDITNLMPMDVLISKEPTWSKRSNYATRNLRHLG